MLNSVTTPFLKPPNSWGSFSKKSNRHLTADQIPSLPSLVNQVFNLPFESWLEKDICALFLTSCVPCIYQQTLFCPLSCFSVAVPAAAPPVGQPKGATNGPYATPRLSISSRATVVARMEGASQGGLQTVMKWKTVVAIFVVVVVYLVTGGLVFRALEQPFESSQKNTIALEKAEFLRDHICVSPQELETLIQVSGEGGSHS